MVRQLRLLSLTEATSYLALLAAAVVKLGGGPQAGVTVLGPVHGVLYLVFVAAICLRRSALGWEWSRAFMAMIIGSLPLGGFWLERNWFAPLDRPRSALKVS